MSKHLTVFVTAFCQINKQTVHINIWTATASWLMDQWPPRPHHRHAVCSFVYCVYCNIVAEKSHKYRMPSAAFLYLKLRIYVYIILHPVLTRTTYKHHKSKPFFLWTVYTTNINKFHYIWKTISTKFNISHRLQNRLKKLLNLWKITTLNR